MHGVQCQGSRDPDRLLPVAGERVDRIPRARHRRGASAESVPCCLAPTKSSAARDSASSGQLSRANQWRPIGRRCPRTTVLRRRRAESDDVTRIIIPFSVSNASLTCAVVLIETACIYSPLYRL